MSSPQNPMLFLVPDPLVGKTVGGYVVEQPLGEGGMGLVFRARHPILNRYFAIKVLRPEVADDAAISSNFIREAQTLSSLKHPHIIDIVGFGPLEDGRQYMVTEFLEGHSLEAELANHGQLPPARALELADQILDALTAAHSVGVIHRDLKPANVFLSRASGGGEVVKLLDFGLAKQQPQEIAELSLIAPAGTSVLAGTPEYIAPEQAQGKPASRQSDLYSFGIMLFEMLTGLLPFLPDEREVDRIRSLLKMHIHQPPPTISATASGFFPAELEDLVADLLKKQPEERPGSADTVRSRLAQVQRRFQQESTATAQANPLLAAFPAAAAPRLETRPLPVAKERDTQPLPPPAVVPLPVAVEKRSGRGGWLGAALALALLLLAGFWFTRRGTSTPVVLDAPGSTPSPGIAEVKVDPAPAPPPPPAVPAPSATAPVAAVIPVPAPAPAPAPAPVAAVAPAPEPAAPKAGKKYRVEIRKTGCEPNERWRNEARANLQEIQQAAAARDDRTSWGQFEKAEPEISSAIGSAATGEDCEAVEVKIQKLARKFKP